MELDESIKELLNKGHTSMQARTQLLQQGFLEEEVDRALNTTASKQRTSTEKKTNRLLATKETLDRVGYGFASPQFINILFFMSGGSFFLIGLFNGLKTILSLLLSSFLQEYSKFHTISKERISNAGLVFGFSFFLMAFAALAKIPWLFEIGFLLGTIGIVVYGDLYNSLVKKLLKHERKNTFLRKAAFYGVAISAISLLLSGFLIDKLVGQELKLFGLELQLHGFLLSFMITAFAFIIGSYVMSKLSDKREKKSHSFKHFFNKHIRAVWTQGKVFLKNPYVFLLLLPATLTGLLQILGASYYGIYIFQIFENSLLGGFTNVAILYVVALLASLFGPFFTKLVQKSTGLAPHLVFGTILTAILPFVLVYNHHFYAVMAALITSVIGAAIVGTAQGLLIQKLMDAPMRKAFFVTQAFLVAIPYLILIPVGAWIAEVFGLKIIFLVIAFGLVLVVMPLYFLLVALTNKMRL